MTTFMVAWMAVSWSCPWGLGKAPDFVKGLVCGKEEKVEQKLFVKSEDARKFIGDLNGKTVSAIEVKGTRTRTMGITQRTELK